MKLPAAIIAYITAFPEERRMIMALAFQEASKVVDTDPRRACALLDAAGFPPSAVTWA